MSNGDAATEGSVVQGALRAGTEVRRGPGRPPGSANKPKPPTMSLAQRQALKAELGAVYRQATIDLALVETRKRGVTSLIQTKLGKEALAEIQAEVVGGHEIETVVAAGQEGPQRLAA